MLLNSANQIGSLCLIDAGLPDSEQQSFCSFASDVLTTTSTVCQLELYILLREQVACVRGRMYMRCASL